MKLLYKNEKVSTDILGLNKLLFGGIQLQTITESELNPNVFEYKELVTVISGKCGTSRALLAMQIMHGITKNLRLMASKNKLDKGVKLGNPVFLSMNDNKINLSDMIMDNLISKCVNTIIEDNIKCLRKEWEGTAFCSNIFDIKLEEIENKHLKHAELDLLLSEEVIVYNNRTNALHFVLPQNGEEENYNDTSNLIAFRKHDNINEYCNAKGMVELKHLNDNFFPINLYSITDLALGAIERGSSDVCIPCLVIVCDDDINLYRDDIIDLRKKSLMTIFVVDEDAEADYKPDLLIELRCAGENSNDYMRHELCFRKSVLQTTALGWHRYKKRDYGIEVYPSVHVLLQRRRHMPKALLRGYVDVLTDTYQQYIDEHSDKRYYDGYLTDKQDLHWERLRTIYRTLQTEQNICKLLDDILIPSKREGDSMEGQVTVIIGEPNSYKRYLALGGTFSACCRKEHTLNILLDQESYTMRKRMVCPTWAFKARKNKISCEGMSQDCKSCQNRCKLPFCHICYEFIHFWDLRMGYISADEFFYYLIRQIRFFPKSNNGENKGLRRIVIDDIQKIDYSFPLVREDPLFLPALIAICKDRGVDLCILCDKSASLVQNLRSLADNVICMERLDEKDCRVYVERYSGYNAPSHIFGGKIENIEDLFICDKRKYTLYANSIKPIVVPNMNHFWVSNDTNKISNSLKNNKR